MRRQFATVAVVALLLVAGCSAVNLGGGSQSDSADTLGSDGQMYEAPLDGSTVAENHEAAIAEAGTFTLVSNTVQSRGQQSQTVNSTVAVNYDTGALLSQQAVGQRTISTYVLANGSAYQRFESSRGTQYRQPPRPANASLYASSRIDALVTAFSYSHVGTETVDGTETEVYVASGAEDLNASASAFQSIDPENVTTLESRVYVTEDGLVKRFEYEIRLNTDGTETGVDVTQTYSRLGETTVEEPAWLDDARANTTN
jgi:hypothetical protein